MAETIKAEDLPGLVGKELKPSSWMEITQERVNQFADATNDHQFIHIDPEKAAQTPFGGPIAHGCLAPTAGTAMTEGLFPEAVFKLMAPETVSPAVVFLAGPDAPSRKVLAAGAGSFAVFKGFETDGVNLLPDNVTPEGVAAAWEAINDEAGMKEYMGGFEQSTNFAMKAAKNLGIKLS